jgi:hypothetical protein
MSVKNKPKAKKIKTNIIPVILVVSFAVLFAISNSNIFKNWRIESFIESTVEELKDDIPGGVSSLKTVQQCVVNEPKYQNNTKEYCYDKYNVMFESNNETDFTTDAAASFYYLLAESWSIKPESRKAFMSRVDEDYVLFEGVKTIFPNIDCRVYYKYSETPFSTQLYLSCI